MDILNRMEVFTKIWEEGDSIGQDGKEQFFSGMLRV